MVASQELRYLFLASPQGDVADFKIRDPANSDELEKEVQRSLLEQLAEMEAISIVAWNEDLYSVLKCGDFKKTYDLYKSFTKDIDIATNDEVIFEDEIATLFLGRKKCKLPPYGNEHQLSQAMSQYLANEPVDASLVYEEMKGSDAVWGEKSKRMLKDTVRAINNRSKLKLGLPVLFKIEQGTITRLR